MKYSSIINLSRYLEFVIIFLFIYENISDRNLLVIQKKKISLPDDDWSFDGKKKNYEIRLKLIFGGLVVGKFILELEMAICFFFFLIFETLFFWMLWCSIYLMGSCKSKSKI